MKDEKGNEISGYENDGSILSGNITSHLEYIITLGDINKDISELKLIPFVKILQDERDPNSDEYYNNLEWHKLQSGEYKQKNSLGGEIELTKMEVDSEKIKFAYNLTGFITGSEDMVLVRINDERLGFNVIYPTNIYTKNIDGEEYAVEFNRNIENVGEYSANFKDDEDFKLKDISKIEFALLSEDTIKLIDAEIDLKLPEKSENYLKINNIEVRDIENHDEIDENNVSDETIDLPSNNLINDDENNTDVPEKEISKLEPKVFGKNDNMIGNIKVGMTDNEVKAILGEPNSIIGKEEMMEGGECQYQYEDISIIFIKNNGGENIAYLIDNIGIENKGPRGVSIGDTKEQVISKFYCEEELNIINDNETELYTFENDKYLGSIMEDNRGTIIRYFGDNFMFEVYIDGTERVTAMKLQKAY